MFIMKNYFEPGSINLKYFLEYFIIVIFIIYDTISNIIVD